MSTLGQNDFKSGWIPSDDAKVGRKNGLVRMENLQLDDHAAVSLVRPTQDVNNDPFNANVHSIFTRTIDGITYTYVGLVDGHVLRDDGSGSFGEDISFSTHPAASIKSAFAPSFNNVIICNGDSKIKDTGSTQYVLGVSSPQVAVTATGGAGVVKELNDDYNLTAAEGSTDSSGSHHVLATTDSDTFRYDGYNSFASPINAMDFGSSIFGNDEDTVGVDFRIPDSKNFVSFQLFFYFGTVDGSPDTTPDLSNYYAYQWDLTQDIIIRQGVDQWSHLFIRRGSFIRIGEDNTKDWSNVAGIRVVATFSEPAASLGVGIVSVTGGSSRGPLSGKYDYRQVNVANRGYLAKSSAGPKLDFPLELNNGYAVITPDNTGVAADLQINECWIFRRKTDAEGSDPLAQFMLVKITDDFGSSFNDQVSDDEIFVIGVPLNEFLVSIRDMTFFDDVYEIVPNYFERTLYMTPRDLFISDALDPDAIDTRFTIKVSGDSAEQNLWCIKAGPSSLLLGTTYDIYEVSGELGLLPDGTMNITVRPLGIKQPPISDARYLYKNTLFYIGTDGLNSLTGATNTSFNGALDLLWNGDDRHGQLAFYKAPTNLTNYYITAAKGKLFISVTMRDTSRTCVVYDFRREYWYRYKLSTGVLFTAEDDTLLAGFVDGDDPYLRKIDVPQLAYDTGVPIILRTPVVDDNLPLNRKDAHTFKINFDTGGVEVTVRIYVDESDTATECGTISSTGMSEKVIDLVDVIGIGKSFQLELICDAIKVFRITSWAIEYTARPTQLRSFRIPPNNYGVAGRKRIPAIPLLIDTLGGDVTFTPTIDLVDQTPSVFSTADKQVYNHYFTSDKKGRVIGGKLQCAGVFEFYEAITPRLIEVLPDPARFFIVPPTNLGTQCRKRIIALAFIIDTQGANVTFTPIIDGVDGVPSTVNTQFKQTVIHYFTTNIEGTDISGRLEGATFFEYYDWDLDECISEKMPPPAKRLRIPQDNYGTPARKRHSSYKFVINTRGSDVTFTPRIDESDQTPAVYNTSEKQVVEYFFSADTIGIDIGGLLTGNNPFEYYGSLKPEIIEKLPDRLKFYVIPENNFGVAAKKRIRTIPLVINTNGHDVTFTPIVDNVAQTPTVFNTPNKQTVLHYFTDDSFGIDYKGTLLGTSPFEFYEMLKPEDVQVIPVGKKFDQVGPIEFPKLGKILQFRIRMIPEGTSLSYVMYADDTVIGATGTIATEANKDKVYEVQLPKGINATVFRVELSSADPFHRYYARFKVNKSGMDAEPQWILFGADPDAKIK